MLREPANEWRCPKCGMRQSSTGNGCAMCFAPKPESDPNRKTPNSPGAKLDAGKSPVRRGLLEYFPRACMAVADVSAFGAKKYTWNGWASVPGGLERYGDAEVRHICKAAIEGDTDKDSGLLHAAHEAWGALARLEFLLREKEGGNNGK